MEKYDTIHQNIDVSLLIYYSTCMFCSLENTRYIFIFALFVACFLVLAAERGGRARVGLRVGTRHMTCRSAVTMTTKLHSEVLSN